MLHALGTLNTWAPADSDMWLLTLAVYVFIQWVYLMPKVHFRAFPAHFYLKQSKKFTNTYLPTQVILTINTVNNIHPSLVLVHKRCTSFSSPFLLQLPAVLSLIDSLQLRPLAWDTSDPPVRPCLLASFSKAWASGLGTSNTWVTPCHSGYLPIPS